MNTNTERKNYISGLLVLVVLGIFAVCVLLVLLAGTDVYNGLTERDQAAYESRTATQFLTTKVRQAENGEAIAIRDFGGCDALVFTEDADGGSYTILVYCWDGWLREYYADTAALDWTADMEFGEKLLPADALTLTLDGSLLRAELTLDGETHPVMLQLRGKEGAYEE